MFNHILLASAGAVAALAALPAAAQVTYTLDGFSDVISAPQSVSFTLDRYLTHNKFIPTTAFDSCASATPCAGLQFNLNDPFNGFSGYSLFDFKDGTSGTFYYFQTSDLATNGIYSNSAIGFNAARLTISGTQLTVPEPAAWTTMILGFLCLGASVRHAKWAAQRA